MSEQGGVEVGMGGKEITMDLVLETVKKIFLKRLVPSPVSSLGSNTASSQEDSPDGGKDRGQRKKVRTSEPPRPQAQKKKSNKTKESPGSPPRAKRSRGHGARGTLVSISTRSSSSTPTTSGAEGMSRERRTLIGRLGVGMIMGRGDGISPAVKEQKVEVVVRTNPCASGLTDCVADAGGKFPCRRCHGEFYCSQVHLEESKARHEPLCKNKASFEVITDNPEYDNWLKYGANQLYDLCLNFLLIWPSLTVQWFPEEKTFGDTDPYRIRHKLLMGTQTDGGEMNHLLIYGLDTLTHSKYDGELQVVQRINHGKEVHRARIMPFNTNIIATRSPSSDVFIFDLATFPELPPDDNTVAPTLRLQGNTQEERDASFALCWSPHASDSGKLVAGSSHGEIYLWDVNASGLANGAVSGGGATISPLSRFKYHTALVEDVSWNSKDPHTFASCGDDKRLILWDARDSGPPRVLEFAHEGNVNSVAFSRTREYVLATGGSDTVISIWDTRRFSEPLQSISKSFKNEVYRVEWSPDNDAVLAGTGDDGHVALCDIATLRDKLEEGREESDFIHAGHVVPVNDIAWCTDEEGIIASVATDNILQVWKPTGNLLHNKRPPEEGEKRGKGRKRGVNCKVKKDEEDEELDVVN